MSYARSQMHRADNNRNALVELFQRLNGYWVPYANKPFDGWALHARFGYMPVELKDPKKEGWKDEYTPRQKKLMKQMTDAGAKWLVWRTEDDVYRAIGAQRTA